MMEGRKSAHAGRIAAFAAVTTILMLVMVCGTEEMRTDARTTVLAVFLPLTALMVTVTHAAIKRGMRPERFFLMLYIPLGLAMMAAIPIMRVPDEPAHIERCWQISIGRLLPGGEAFMRPVNLLDEDLSPAQDVTMTQVAATAGVELDMENLVPAGLGANTGFYPVNNYFPQALGMAVVRLFTTNRLAILYGARMGAFLTAAALMYYAIRRTPVGKYVIMAVALLPMALQEAASASADGLTIAVCMAFLAMIFDMYVNKTPMTPGRYAWLFVLTFATATFKVFYCPLILLLFAAPEACFGGTKQKRRAVACILASVLAIVAGWMLLCMANYVTGGTGEAGHMIAQVRWMMRHPFGFAATVVRTLMYSTADYLTRMIGSSLGTFNVELPSTLYVALLSLLVVAAARDRALPVGRMGVWLLTLTAVITLLLCTGLFIWWSPEGGAWVQGMQGRYFLPLAFVICMGVSCGKQGGDEPGAMRAVGMMALTMAATIGFVIMVTFA